jgi:FkbM family methyltransferase
VISYAQNLEDVLLARALAGVDQGYYIDVGAFDPDVDSVTRHFYDAGWCGINIEPAAAQLALFTRTRLRDTNLNVALGRTNGTLTFHDFSPLGVSTLDPVVADEMRARGFAEREITVPVVTLAQVCRDHDVRKIDFLKIDVEGYETEVLAGHDWNFVRPRILLVEATRPMSTTPSFDAWEPMILRQGYLFAWFDGLNRYYVRREDADLLAHFRIPPNIFDGYVVARRDSSGQLLAALATRIKRQLLHR